MHPQPGARPVEIGASGCGRGTPGLWRTRRNSRYVERNPRETLAVPGLWAIELLPRTSSGGCGIGRRRRSVRRRGGLPHRGRGGQVTGPPGSEEPADRPGASPVPVTAVNCRATDLCRGTAGHHLKGPCRSYRRGPFAYFRTPIHLSSRPAPTRHVPVASAQMGGTGLDHSSPGEGLRCGREGSSCGRRGSNLWTALRKTDHPTFLPESPCPRRVRRHRTSPTHFLRGVRDRTETRIHTTPRRLAAPGSRGRMTGPPGSEEPAGSTGSVIDTGHSGELPGHGLVPGHGGSPPKGPCRSYRQGPFDYFARIRPTSPAMLGVLRMTSPWRPGER